MVFLLFLYVFLILFIASTTFDHIVDNTSLLEGDSLIIGIPFYIIPMFVGILLIAAMLKPLIARPASKRFAIALSRKKEQALYSFVDKLCQSIGAKIPSSIEVDCSVHASAGFRRGMIGFLEDELTLIIGLPAAYELTTTEFTSLLAHELGHFTQKLGMRLYYIITSIQGWFYRLVFEEDEIDQKLAILSITSSGFLRWFVIPAANLSVWLSRNILTAFMFAGNVISRFYIRLMEFDADRYAVRLSGPEAFESFLSKLHLLNIALKEAFSQLKMQRKPGDNSLPNDFVLLISSIMKQTPAGETSKAKEAALKKLTGIPDKNPTDQERIEKVRSIPAKAVPQSDALASTLFTNFKETAKITSSRLYREVLGLQFGQDSLVPTDEFVGASGQAPELTENQTEIDTNFF
jgi:hypothetical protein